MKQCKWCKQPISFDSNIVSQFSGNQIALDPKSGNPHKCDLIDWTESQECRGGEIEIHFHDKIRGNNGNCIPHLVDAGVHYCPVLYQNILKKKIPFSISRTSQSIVLEKRWKN